MFKPAKRTQAKIKLALTGPSGSGKTYSALLIASGLGKKIAVLDTENASASLYSGLTPFDTVSIAAPYTTERYIEVIQAAEKAGYDVLIIDSITHAWSGSGGLLEQKEKLDARGGNSYTNWAKITPKHEAFLNAIVSSSIHIICTMRSKQDYVLSDRNGKQVPQKVGLAPVQREGAEYEFTTVLDIGMDHSAQASKDRTGLFGDLIFRVTQETGEKLKAWLDGAEVAVVEPAPPPLVAAPKPIAPKAPQEPEPPCLEEYLPKFGKYSASKDGTRSATPLGKIDIRELEEYVVYLETEAEKANKPMRPDVKEFVELATKLIQATEKEEVPW